MNMKQIYYKNTKSDNNKFPCSILKIFHDHLQNLNVFTTIALRKIDTAVPYPMPTSTPMIPIKGAKTERRLSQPTGVKYFYDVYIKLTGNSVPCTHIYTQIHPFGRMYLRSSALPTYLPTDYESITDFLL